MFLPFSIRLSGVIFYPDLIILILTRSMVLLVTQPQLVAPFLPFKDLSCDGIDLILVFPTVDLELDLVGVLMFFELCFQFSHIAAQKTGVR